MNSPMGASIGSLSPFIHSHVGLGLSPLQHRPNAFIVCPRPTSAVCNTDVDDPKKAVASETVLSQLKADRSCTVYR